MLVRRTMMPVAVACLLAGAAFAGQPEVIGASAGRAPDGWRFEVTVRHADTGWEHYADAWRIVGPDGEVYGTRELLHPHVDEQPFTRSLSGVQVPPGTRRVFVEARDTLHGWGPARELVLPE